MWSSTGYVLGFVIKHVTTVACDIAGDLILLHMSQEPDCV